MENGTTEQVPWSREQMFLTIADLCAGSGLPVPKESNLRGDQPLAVLRFDSIAGTTAWVDALGGFTTNTHTYRPDWREGPITSVYHWRVWGGWHFAVDAWDPATADEIAELEAREAAAAEAAAEAELARREAAEVEIDQADAQEQRDAAELAVQA